MRHLFPCLPKGLFSLGMRTKYTRGPRQGRTRKNSSQLLAPPTTPVSFILPLSALSSLSCYLFFLFLLLYQPACRGFTELLLKPVDPSLCFSQGLSVSHCLQWQRALIWNFKEEGKKKQKRQPSTKNWSKRETQGGCEWAAFKDKAAAPAALKTSPEVGGEQPATAAPANTAGGAALVPRVCPARAAAMVGWWAAPCRAKAVTSAMRTDGLSPCCPQLPPGNLGTAVLLPELDFHSSHGREHSSSWFLEHWPRLFLRSPAECWHPRASIQGAINKFEDLFCSAYSLCFINEQNWVPVWACDTARVTLREKEQYWWPLEGLNAVVHTVSGPEPKCSPTGILIILRTMSFVLQTVGPKMSLSNCHGFRINCLLQPILGWDGSEEIRLLWYLIDRL